MGGYWPQYQQTRLYSYGMFQMALCNNQPAVPRLTTQQQLTAAKQVQMSSRRSSTQAALTMLPGTATATTLQQHLTT
jgi:hypothetical protein